MSIFDDIKKSLFKQDYFAGTVLNGTAKSELKNFYNKAGEQAKKIYRTEMDRLKNRYMNYVNFASSAIALGAFDSTLPSHLFGWDAQIYQNSAMATSAVASYLTLKGEERVSNILRGSLFLTHMTAMDTMSIIFQEGSLDILPLDPRYIIWRAKDFGETFWEGMSNMISQPSVIIPGATYGHDLGFFIAPAIYLATTRIAYHFYNKWKLSKLEKKMDDSAEDGI